MLGNHKFRTVANNTYIKITFINKVSLLFSEFKFKPCFTFRFLKQSTCIILKAISCFQCLSNVNFHPCELINMGSKNWEGKRRLIKARERIVGCRRLSWLKLKRWHASIGATCQRPAGPHRRNWNCSAVLQFRDLLPTRHLIPPYQFLWALYFFRFHPLLSIPLERGVWRGSGLCFISYPIRAVYLQTYKWVFFCGL